MEDSVAASYCCPGAAEWLPGNTDAWLECGLVHFNANSAVGSDSGDQEPSCLEIEVSLSVLRFGHRCRQSPAQPQVQGKIPCYAPGILSVGTKHFPAPPRRFTFEGLIVQPQEWQA